jgi:hypothetical protein
LWHPENIDHVRVTTDKAPLVGTMGKPTAGKDASRGYPKILRSLMATLNSQFELAAVLEGAKNRGLDKTPAVATHHTIHPRGARWDPV